MSAPAISPTTTTASPDVDVFSDPHDPTACELDPASWDVDHGELPDWMRAIRNCIECPLKLACWEKRNRLYPEDHPAGVIWAGTLYTEDSVPITAGDELVRYATKLLRERREEERRDQERVLALEPQQPLRPVRPSVAKAA